MDGILNINKPGGRTSFSVVAMVRRLSGEKRVGHAGTLDPAATGVLPVCLGRGTRITEYLMDDTKAYRAGIELGVTTDTYDSEGEVTGRSDPSGVSLSQVESALSSFIGEISQVPPMYSALKHRGRPLYKLARAGISVERESRPVYIHSIEIADWQTPVVTIEVVCGKGTYIRSLAHDLGQTLGCGACLESLVRTRCGVFDIKDAVALDQLEEAFEQDSWRQMVYPVDSVLSHLEAVEVSEEMEKNILNGRPVVLDVTVSASGNSCRAYASGGEFIAVLRFDPDKGHWRPQKVFR